MLVYIIEKVISNSESLPVRADRRLYFRTFEQSIQQGGSAPDGVRNHIEDIIYRNRNRQMPFQGTRMTSILSRSASASHFSHRHAFGSDDFLWRDMTAPSHTCSMEAVRLTHRKVSFPAMPRWTLLSRRSARQADGPFQRTTSSCGVTMIELAVVPENIINDTGHRFNHTLQGSQQP